MVSCDNKYCTSFVRLSSFVIVHRSSLVRVACGLNFEFIFDHKKHGIFEIDPRVAISKSQSIKIYTPTIV